MARALVELGRRRPEVLVAPAAAGLTLVPAALSGGVLSAGEWIGQLATLAGALCLAGWRWRPAAVLACGPALLLVPLLTGPGPEVLLLLVLAAYAVLAAERFSGRAALAAGAACVGYLVLVYAVTGDDSPGLAILTLPGFVAGTVLRLRRELAEALAERGRELEAERELFAEVSVRNERARIASELHDIVGHALSAMVVQAAAGQRLAERSPGAAAGSMAAIAASARQGQADLQRLVDLLAGTGVAGPDLSLVDEVVAQAARSGLRVTCRLEGDRDGLAAEAAHTAFRVVQESLTNALRHAPGAEVRVLVRGEAGGRTVTVRVENDAGAGTPSAITGTGLGLIGLRERVVGLGGTFSAGPAGRGGWAVEAHLSAARP